MTTEKIITIPMSERAPLKIVKDEWPVLARGEWHEGQYGFQAFDGARITVRQHADGRAVVYGVAGDWDGGGRPGREDRSAGFLVSSGDDIVRAIRRVGGILALTDCVGEGAHTAERRCIADLPAEELAPGHDVIRMPREGATRLVRALRDAALRVTDLDIADHLSAIADELAKVLAG